MPYRHFFTQKRAATPEEWARITEAFGKVVGAAADVRLKGLKVDHEVICFDGPEGHQVMRMTRTGEGKSMCVTGKTRDERQAYVEAKTPFIWAAMQRASQWSQEVGWVPGPSDA